MQTRHADVINPVHAVAHGFRRDRRLLRHRQVARAGAQDRDGARRFLERPGLDRDAARHRVIDRPSKPLAQGAGVIGRDPRDQHSSIRFDDARRNLHHLIGRFARAINHLGETFAQGAMSVHLGKTKISHRSGLKSAQHRVAVDEPVAKTVEQFGGFGGCHGGKSCHALFIRSRGKSKNAILKPGAQPA